jgi:hypothetical protein
MTSALIVRADTRCRPVRSTTAPRGDASHRACSAAFSVLDSTCHILLKRIGFRQRDAK